MKNHRNRFKPLGMLALTMLWSVPACGAGDAAAGKAVYENKCMICHGADGASATGYAKALGLEPAHLGSDRVQKKSDAEIKKIVQEGSGKMKPVKGLSDQDLENVITYVRTLTKK